MEKKLKIKPTWTRATRRGRAYRRLMMQPRQGIRGLPNRLSQLQLSRMASSISYFMVFAMFPLVILIVSLVAVFGDSFIRSVLRTIDTEAFLPGPVIDILRSLMDNLVESQSATLISASILTLLWAASKGVNALMLSLSEIYRRGRRQKGYLVNRLFSLVLTLVTGLFIAFIMLVLAFGEAVLARLTVWTGITVASPLVIRLTTFGTGFAILTLTLSIIFYFSSGRRGRIQDAAGSAALASLSWVLLSAAFSLYVNWSRSLSFYGSLTGIIVLMLWLYMSSYTLLLAAVWHSAVLDRRRRLTFGQKDAAQRAASANPDASILPKKSQ